uniref:Uncharacterized protein n=1 Tax=Physcomitrium patens TaxID=3218 RepID=A0A2K1LB10_PHYPA|nr:hypothetical protein PHYPA_001632 [Physcomitrium patens]
MIKYLLYGPSKSKNIKYLFKYMYKGNDQATIKIIRLIDEIKQYLNARYLNIIEAIDFLLPFCTHFEKRLVKCLVVYLQIKNHKARDEIIHIAWFAYNTKNEALHNVLYINFICRYVYLDLVGGLCNEVPIVV